ncbi:MAG TPA: DegQ family serine endoprotease [Alphaproteobacteria bacterium]|nr:DegQ family serine endoprotease [Alphaproteobacteria bacterium]
MKLHHLLIILTLALASIPAAFVFAQAPVAAVPPPGAPASFAGLAEKLLPAVVNISSTQKIMDTQDFPELPQFPEGSPFEDFFNEFMDRRGRGAPSAPPASLGSGFIIDAKEGYIVTNNHVIRDAEKIRITLHNDETLDAEVIGTDEKTDLAVLKVKSDKPLSAVEFGNSDILRVGDWVLAIGNPFGLGGTVTAGIVSARQRDISAGPYDDFIQTDASINRGNSGGPMFDLNGQVIGINTAIFSPSGGSVGIGFAIPSALASPVIDQIIKYGRTRRGWVGVRIQEVTPEIAESLGLEKPRGALVASITPGGPAEKAGIKAGDIILTFNGQDLSDMKTLPRLVAETDIGSTAELAYWRDGKEGKVSLTVAELEKAEEEGLVASGPKTEPTGKEVEGLGLTLKALTPVDRSDFNIPADVDGLFVSHVKIGSEAAEKGLMEGDVIVEINQQKTGTPDAFIDTVDQAKKAGRASVLLLVNGGGDMRFVALKLK